MSAIQTLLSDDHRACDDRFAEIEKAIQGGQWAAAGAAMAGFARAMESHLAVEETTLFPAFEEATGSAMGPTRVMRMEHEQIRALIAAMVGAVAAKDAEDYAGQAETLLIMMQQHNMKEENILYPMCDQTLAGGAGTMAGTLAAQLAAARSDA